MGIKFVLNSCFVFIVASINGLEFRTRRLVLVDLTRKQQEAIRKSKIYQDLVETLRVAVNFKSSALLPRAGSGIMRMDTTATSEGNSLDRSLSISKSSSMESPDTSASLRSNPPVVSEKYLKNTKSQVLELISPRQVMSSSAYNIKVENTTTTTSTSTVSIHTGSVEQQGRGVGIHSNPLKVRAREYPNLRTSIAQAEKNTQSLPPSRIQDSIHRKEMKQKINPLALKSRGKAAFVTESSSSSNNNNDDSERNSNARSSNNSNSASATRILSIHPNESTTSYIDSPTSTHHHHNDDFV